MKITSTHSQYQRNRHSSPSQADLITTRQLESQLSIQHDIWMEEREYLAERAGKIATISLGVATLAGLGAGFGLRATGLPWLPTLVTSAAGFTLTGLGSYMIGDYTMI